MAQLYFQNSRGTVRINVFADPAELAAYVADRVVAFTADTKTATLCVASGESPKKTYAALADRHASGRFDTSSLTVIKLDEWYAMSMDDPSSCEVFVRERVLVPLEIPDNRYIAFDSNTADPDGECVRVNHAIDTAGGIGLAIVGVGKNGHIGLNEPGTSLELRSHRTKISHHTKAHSMLTGQRPEFGLTLGMRDLLASRRLIVLVRGDGKEEAFRNLFAGRIRLDSPVTLMLLHPNLDIVCDEAAISPVRPTIEELTARL